MTGRKNGNRMVSGVDMQFVTASISTTLVLLLLGMVLFFVLTARNLSVYVRENINFSLLLDDGLQNRDVVSLQRSLATEPFVKEVEYISKEQALREYIDDTGADPQEFLGYNPLSASIEIRLRSDYANSDSLAYIKERIGRNAQVKDIVYQQELVDAVNRNIGRISLWLLGSWGFIRRPFLWRNFWIGFLSAVVAGGLLWGAAAWVVTREPGLIQVVTPEVMLLVSAALLVSGGLITTLCALLSINKYLRMKAGTLYIV